MNERKGIKKITGIENFGIYMIMLAFIVVVIFIVGPDKFLNVKNLTSLVRSEAVVCIIAIAATLVMITGNIDLSVGWMVGLASVIAASHCQNFWAALLLPMLACGLCGALNGILVGGLKLNAFITTLGTMYVFEGIAYMYGKGKALSGVSNYSTALKGMGQASFLFIPVPVWILLIVAIVFWFILRRTTFGAKVYAVGANKVAARFSGLSPGKVIFLAYTLTGLAVGLAGSIMYAKVMSTQIYAGAGYEFDVLSGIVLGGTSVTGGKGNIPGTVLGIIFIGVLGNGFTLMGLSSDTQYIAQGIILLIAVGADVMRERKG